MRTNEIAIIQKCDTILVDLSIVIVNWKSKTYVSQCLNSIYKNLCGLMVQIIVIDNASFDGCGELLLNKFPAVTFIQLSKNIGFAKANNVGVSNAKGKSILFLNPDTVIIENALSRLINALDLHSDAGLIGAHILNSNLSIQTSCITASPGIINQSLKSNLLIQLFPRCKIWGIQALFDNTTCPISVEAISGACMLGRRHIIESVGAFSTDYFMYAEDMDLCHKIRQAGWKVYYVPDARIIHHGGCSSSLSDKQFLSDVAQHQSLYRFFEKFHGSLYAWCYRLSVALASFTRLILLAFLYLPVRLVARRQSVPKAFRKWCTILTWSIGLG